MIFPDKDLHTHKGRKALQNLSMIIGVSNGFDFRRT